MSWIVNDSEEEDGFDAFPKPPGPQLETQDQSSISNFTTRPTLPTLEKPSPISNFTADNSSKILNASTDSIVVDSTAASAPAKPKRVKPRPKFRASAAHDDSIQQSTPSTSANVAGISQLESIQSPQAFDDPSFSLAERTKTRKRKSTSTPSSRKDDTHNSSNSSGVKSFANRLNIDVIVLSSDTEQDWGAGPSLPERGKNKAPRRSSPVFRVPDLPHAGDSSILPPSDPPSSVVLTTHATSPLFDRSAMNHESTPPSSPIQMRKAKRRVIDDDDDFRDDTTDAEIHKDKGTSSSASAKDGEPSAKKQKKTTEKKPREKKSKASADEDGTSAPKPAKKRQPKVKAKEKEQEFKSNEFVDDSEDDILLVPVPKSSKSTPHASYSDPASTGYSVQASVDASIRPTMLDPTEMIQASSSVIPSLASTTGPSAFISEPPSADLTAPPPSPSVRPTPSSEKPKAAKPRKKRPAAADTSLSTSLSPDRLTTSLDLDKPTPALIPESATETTQKKKKADKKDKKGKGKADVFVLIDDTRKQDDSLALNDDDAGPVEQSTTISVSEKPRPKAKKDRKKQGTIISSDEDEPEPECASSKEVPTEVESDKAKGSHSENKENETVPSIVQVPKTPAPPPSTPQVRPPASKPRTSSSQMPQRRDSMSALIRRVSSKVQSPIGTPSPTYSPLSKASRATLSRIAPLHPNRRTPPPAPPRPPAPKKSKKMLDLEEKWEEELAESVEGWSCMGDAERAALRRAKRDAELGYDD